MAIPDSDSVRWAYLHGGSPGFLMFFALRLYVLPDLFFSII